MTLWYVTGNQFDAQAEAEALLRSPSTGKTQLYSVIDIVDSFQEGGKNGFSTIPLKWDHAGIGDIFIYRAAGVAGAINVPGSGRGQTYDLTFIGIALIPSPSFATEQAFLSEMGRRKSVGTDHRW